VKLLVVYFDCELSWMRSDISNVGNVNVNSVAFSLLIDGKGGWHSVELYGHSLLDLGDGRNGIRGHKNLNKPSQTTSISFCFFLQQKLRLLGPRKRQLGGPVPLCPGHLYSFSAVLRICEVSVLRSQEMQLSDLSRQTTLEVQ
jgi:hypothetical protein